MKQGTNSVMGVRIVGDLTDLEKALFKFTQGSNHITFEYPSEKAMLDSVEPNVINLYWSNSDTFMFEAGKPMYMDTLIKYYGMDSTPETPIKEIVMSPTLFRQMEVKQFYD